MAKKTFAQLKKSWHERDHADWFVDVFDSVRQIDNITSAVDAGTGYAIYVSKGGDDTNGNGGKVNPYLTIGKALTEVDSDKQTVFIEPGTYQENLTWPTETACRVVGFGRRGAVTISDDSSGGTAVISIAPGTALGATMECWLENLHIDHKGTGVYVDDTSMAEKVIVYMDDVSTNQQGGTSVLTQGGNAADAIRIYMQGEQDEIEGPIYLEIKNAGDRFRATNMILSGGLESSADDIAAEITLKNCEVKHAGISGGHGSQKVNAIGCWSLTGSTYAMFDTADLAGSHTENLIPDPGAAWPT